MAWYYILFFSVFAFFFIKMIITLVLGDTDIDVDVDADGDIDFDVSSMFSFKGVLHFLLGFSSYLAAIARFKGNNFDTFDFGDYIIAVCVGVLFMYCLFQLYRLMMKLNHYNSENIDINNYMCTILINNGLVDMVLLPDHSEHDHAYSYTVLVNTEVGSRKITLLSQHENLQIGSTRKIHKNEYGIYYI